jgi:hypothetical protein
VIASDGTVKEIHVISGHPLLAPAAINAVKQWKYEPYRLCGKVIEVSTKTSVTFRLVGGGGDDGQWNHPNTQQQLDQSPARLSADILDQVERGDAQAQYKLGLAYENGQGVAMDEVEAIAWYRKAVAQGNKDARCALMRRIIADQNANQTGITTGNPQDQVSVGRAYQSGNDGVPKDDVEAVRWYRKAAEQGYAEAQWELGNMYDNGQGVEQDEAEARRWWSKAAKQGYSVATENIAAQERRQFAQSVANIYQQRLPRNGVNSSGTFFRVKSRAFTAPDVNVIQIETNQIALPTDAQKFLQSSSWTSRAFASGFHAVRLINGSITCDFRFVTPTSIHPLGCVTEDEDNEYVRRWPKDYEFAVR